MALVQYSFALLSTSKVSLLNHIERILQLRPEIAKDVEAFRVEEPELWELEDGKLKRHWPPWYEVTLWTWHQLSEQDHQNLEYELEAEGQIMARDRQYFVEYSTDGSNIHGLKRRRMFKNPPHQQQRPSPKYRRPMFKTKILQAR